MESLNGERITAGLLDVLVEMAEHGLAGLPPDARIRWVGAALGRVVARQSTDVDSLKRPGDGHQRSAAAGRNFEVQAGQVLVELAPRGRLLATEQDKLIASLGPVDRLVGGPSTRERLIAAVLGSAAAHQDGLARTRLALRLIEGETCWVLTVRLAPQGVPGDDEDEYRRDAADDLLAAIETIDAGLRARTGSAAGHEERARLLAEMAASVAHGLNNLLGAVVGQSSQLLDAAQAAQRTGQTAVDVEPSSGLRLIHQAALDGAGLARRLLRLSRGETIDDDGTLDLVDLGRVLLDAVELTRPCWQDEAARRGVSIEPAIEIAQPLLIRGVSSDLREIVVNLILNAVDAMPEGGRLLLRGDLDNGTVVVRCQDSGVGMAPAVLERVFEPFFTTKGRKGTGMGLPIVYGVVARHGGDVRVTSTPGSGTTITLRLPAVALTHGSLVAPSAPTGRAVDPAADLAPLAVLVVDDDPVFRSVFTRRLSLDARRVEAVGDGASALATVEAGAWDLLCIDEGLPDRSGRDLVAEIRHRGYAGAVVLVTGSATAPNDPTLLSAGIDAVLPKPCSDAELVRAVRTACARLAPPSRRPERQPASV
jgi:signal transduction histidine kinase/ActR/RegA family two-component response regulator